MGENQGRPVGQRAEWEQLRREVSTLETVTSVHAVCKMVRRLPELICSAADAWKSGMSASVTDRAADAEAYRELLRSAFLAAVSLEKRLLGHSARLANEREHMRIALQWSESSRATVSSR